MRPSVIAAVLLAQILPACVSLPEEPTAGNAFRLQPEPPEGERLPADRPLLGIALSGGGLRSALFSIGALKALHEQGVLGRATAISSVSGGGYAAYWLYSHELAASQGRFGDAALGEGVFTQRMCELMTTADFVPLKSMIARGFHPTGAVSLYDRSLQRTFGPRDGLTKPFLLEQIQSKSSAGLMPYWIVNTTLISPKPTGWRDGLYEFTPFFAGNEKHGYAPWISPSMPARTAVRISGAAVQPLLKQRFIAPNPALSQVKTVAADGGLSENLGAVALIRRGIPDVIIIDAEHDPRYRFGAYLNLRKRLRAYGLTLRIKAIDDYLAPGAPALLPTAVLHGEVTKTSSPDAPVTRIRYVKMALPKTIATTANDPQRVKRGLGADERFYGAVDTATGGAVTDCTGVKLLGLDLTSWFSYYVSAYARFMREDSYTRYSSRIRWNTLRADYPQYLTADQSFYQDQAIAFVGLGYLAASELRTQ